MRDMADIGSPRQCPRFAVTGSKFCTMHTPGMAPKRDKRGRILKGAPAIVAHVPAECDNSQCAACAAIDPHMTENGIAEHTPGPLPLHLVTGRNLDVFVIVTNQGSHYATTYDPAAARLIVAAPDLLAELKKLLKMYEEVRVLNGFPIPTITTESARAAILRATGGK